MRTGVTMGFISASGTGFAERIADWATLRKLTLAAAALACMGASPVSRLDVTFSKVRSEKGLLRVCLTADPANFPACVDDTRAVTRSIPATSRELRFDGLAPGQYAIAVIHDENSNKKLDTMLGIPREGFGFSRNPAIGFGPPKFAAARFAIEADGGATQDIRLKYLL